jgi:hypothetical protein
MILRDSFSLDSRLYYIVQDHLAVEDFFIYIPRGEDAEYNEVVFHGNLQECYDWRDDAISYFYK